jgi:pyrimidine 5'-nucleotidase
MHVAIGEYVVEHVGVSPEEADQLRQKYWLRYGATLLGLVRHHGIRAAHFLDQTHRLPGLEERLRTSAHDRAALADLPGRKFILTNAPRAYAMRVLTTLRLLRHFDGVITIEDMTMFGALRPKPDARMLRQVAAQLAWRRAAASSSRTRWSTSRRRDRSACARCGCSATSAAGFAAPCATGSIRRQARADSASRLSETAYLYAKIGALRHLTRPR